MGKRRVLLGLLVLFGLVCARAAIADTGGSMGGGDWSSSSSGGGYSGGGGSYTYSGGGGSYTYSSGNFGTSPSYAYSSGGGGDSEWRVLRAIGIGIVIMVWFLVWFARRGGSGKRSRDHAGTFRSAHAESVDISVVRVALDGRARKFVQSELARIAGIADTKTAEGRASMLREVCLLLRRMRDAWVYGGAVNEPMRSLGAAKLVFDRHVDDARVRFREETIRNVQGVITGTPASVYTPRSDEGAGVILVSLVIAARTELFTVTRIGDGENLRQALDSLGHLASQQIVAIEIVWQPSEDTDRLSSIELEAKYPSPELIPIQGALVGKTFCTYCGGPFPAELVSCPHCGAPAPGRDAAILRSA